MEHGGLHVLPSMFDKEFHQECNLYPVAHVTTPVPPPSVCLWILQYLYLPSPFHLHHNPCQRLVLLCIGGSFENRSIQQLLTTRHRPSHPLTTGADAPSHRAILPISHKCCYAEEMAKSFHKFYFAHPLAIHHRLLLLLSWLPRRNRFNANDQHHHRRSTLCQAKGEVEHEQLRTITECVPWFGGGAEMLI